jgi:GNAT superfamily N-acetyltransferase
MSGAKFYPDEPAGEFPAPPRAIEDKTGREITLRAVDWSNDLDDLVEMYNDFDAGDRAQGIPPVGTAAIRQWLTDLQDGYDVAAWHGDQAVGHATLVPDDEDGYELAIFVLHSYQGGGIGTAILRTLLGLAQAEGVECVWLTVERWNRPAIHIYEQAGFETTDAASFELEMSIRL